jgi:hypothetical protein
MRVKKRATLTSNPNPNPNSSPNPQPYTRTLKPEPERKINVVYAKKVGKVESNCKHQTATTDHKKNQKKTSLSSWMGSEWNPDSKKGERQKTDNIHLNKAKVKAKDKDKQSQKQRQIQRQTKTKAKLSVFDPNL